MLDFLLTLQGALLIGCLFGLLAIFVGLVVSETVRSWKIWRSKRHVAMLTITALVAAIVGGTKNTRNVNFPRTDPEVAYLIDRGSYVSNDWVHVDFTTFLIPSSADIQLAYWPNESTNEDDMVILFRDTLAAWPRPLDFEFENASSNRWFCFTTWTPGPVIHTNGVWQQDWMMGVSNRNVIIPVRTTVLEDGERVMPPEPKMEDEP